MLAQRAAVEHFDVTYEASCSFGAQPFRHLDGGWNVIRADTVRARAKELVHELKAVEPVFRIDHIVRRCMRSERGPANSVSKGDSVQKTDDTVVVDKHPLRTTVEKEIVLTPPLPTRFKSHP